MLVRASVLLLLLAAPAFVGVAGAAPPPTPDEVVEESERLLRRGKAGDAAFRLAPLVGKAGAAPLVEVTLADALRRMGAREAAVRLDRAAAVPLAGTPGGRAALGRLLDHAEATGDHGDVDALLPRLPDEAWPAERLDRVRYRRGVVALDAGDPVAAGALLAAVPTTSSDYTFARLLLGVSYVPQVKLKSAVRAFTDCARTEVTVRTEAELARVDRTRDLALLDIARVYYGIGNPKDALTYAGYVPTDSPVWRPAQLVAAWAELRLGRDGAPARVAALRGHADLPEADLVVGIDALNRCDLDGAEAAAGRLAAAVALELAPIDAALAAPGEAWAAWRGGASALGPAATTALAADRQLAALGARLAAVGEELGAPSRWGSPGSPLREHVEGAYVLARAELHARGAARLSERLEAERKGLVTLGEQARVLAADVATGRGMGGCPGVVTGTVAEPAGLGGPASAPGVPGR